MTTEAMRRVGGLLFTLMAAGEMAIGVVIAAFPSVGTLLIGAPLDVAGLLVARMLGVALLVIGLTWWLARSEPGRMALHAPGFILYNVGVGALLALAATSASQPLIPWIASLVHLVAGATYVAVVAATASPGPTPRT